MLAGELPCSLQLLSMVSQLLPNSCMSSPGGFERDLVFVIAMKGGPNQWETGKEIRCGRRRLLLLCFL